MKLSELKKSKSFKFLSNKYVIIAVVFIVWMFFFDTNSFFVHQELNQEINELENNKDYFQNEINRDKEFLEKLKDEDEMEKFAREAYYLKKENEDIFIIEHEDSIKSNKQ
ncbi:septum formation initiator family protein [uncultured Planktosalinus sp.]|uniref:FtsB family cell division protein n=1 Tax=uncultured Planktosalinus sp. TaxID=1810935 RepID=UPI0030DD05EE